uniref:Odorant-binding protein 5 n=1 Tax=Chilo suppressalis TaxID=168631 RepID=M9YNS2_CHISP|nr:odorant-binding protein 5 [Chilo suppressalis]
MKLTLFPAFLLFTSILGLKDEHEENLKRWHMECFQETKVNPDLVLKLKMGNWQIKNKLLKEWILCVFNKYDLMSKEGVFKLDTAMSLVPSADRDMIEDYIDACLPKHIAEPLDIAWKYAKCYHVGAKDPINKNKRLHYMTLFY